MMSNKERGDTFRLRCCEALQRDFNREFEPEVLINMGGNFYKKFDAATKERGIVVECKAMVYTETGN